MYYVSCSNFVVLNSKVLNMKMIANLFFLIISCVSFAQQGVLPFTGLRYGENGISAKEIKVELDEATWTGNRLPINTKFEIQLVDPIGFLMEDEMYYPGVELMMTNPAGDTLGYVEDLFSGEEVNAFSDAELSKLSVTLGFNEQSNFGDTCFIQVRFFDKKSTNDITLWFDVFIVDAELPLQQTSSTFGVTSYLGYKGIASGVEISSMSLEVDQGHQVHDIQVLLIDPIIGLSMEEWYAGKSTIFVYDEQLIPSTFPIERCVISVQPADNGEGIAARIEIPVQVGKTSAFNRFRWESIDGKKIVDVVIH